MIKKLKMYLIVSMTIIFSSFISFAAPGDLDSSFNHPNGFTSYDSGNGIDDNGDAFTILSDGKIVVAGYSYDGNIRDYQILRYNVDGTLDTSFGTNGIITIMPDDLSRLIEIKIQEDGKIIVLGSTGTGNDENILIYRYESNWELDDTFGADGIVTYDGGIGADLGFSIAFQNDGKIVVAGYSGKSTNDTDDLLLLRYNIDGTLDDTFGTDGVVIYDSGDNYEYGFGLSIQQDDKIVLTGYIDDTSDRDVLTLRYNSDGTLDDTFGTNGVVIYDGHNGWDSGNDCTVQPDDKILVSGQRGNDTGFEIILLRYDSDGTLDDTFGANGITTYNTEDNWENGVDLALQNNGQIVLIGNSFDPIQNVEDGALLLRSNIDGTMDNTFGSNGVVKYGTGESLESFNRLLIQDDGKIVVLGSIDNGMDKDIIVLRFISDQTTSESSSGCFIATAAYRAPLESYVKILCDFFEIVFY